MDLLLNLKNLFASVRIDKTLSKNDCNNWMPLNIIPAMFNQKAFS